MRGSALRWFYALFGVGTVYLTGSNVFGQVAREGPVGWLHLQSIITDQIVRSAGASLIVAYILTDGGDMVISAILRERNRRRYLAVGRQEGLEEGRQEGLADMHFKWESWNRRREEALQNGWEFNEPPPSLENPNGQSKHAGENGKG